MKTKRPENRLQAISTLERTKDFIPYPTVPPLPKSGTDGLKHKY